MQAASRARRGAPTSNTNSLRACSAFRASRSDLTHRQASLYAGLSRMEAVEACSSLEQLPAVPLNTPATAKKFADLAPGAAPASQAQELKASAAAAGASPLRAAAPQLVTTQLFESPPGAGPARQDSWLIEAQRSDRMEALQQQQATVAAAPALSSLGAQAAGDAASPSLGGGGAYTPASGGWLESARKVRAPAALCRAACLLQLSLLFRHSSGCCVAIPPRPAQPPTCPAPTSTTH